MYLISNYNINKSFVFYPLNNLEQNTISLKNNRLININVECKTCSSETYNYECSQCEAGISGKFLLITPEIFKKLFNIEKKILEEMKLINDDNTFSTDIKDKDKIIKYLQNILKKKNKGKNDNLLFQLFELNKKWSQCEEISYYISKCINLIDHKLVFLLKLYEFIVNLALSKLEPYNYYYYSYYKKYEYIINDLKINLPVNIKEFKNLYQNVPDYVGSFLNFYPSDKSYPATFISLKNFCYDLNFETAANCRIKDNKMSFINMKIEKKLRQNMRDKIRSEFGLKKVKTTNKQAYLPKLEIGLKLINFEERRKNV